MTEIVPITRRPAAAAATQAAKIARKVRVDADAYTARLPYLRELAADAADLAKRRPDWPECLDEAAKWRETVAKAEDQAAELERVAAELEWQARRLERLAAGEAALERLASAGGVVEVYRAAVSRYDRRDAQHARAMRRLACRLDHARHLARSRGRRLDSAIRHARHLATSRAPVVQVQRVSSRATRTAQHTRRRTRGRSARRPPSSADSGSNSDGDPPPRLGGGGGQ